MKEEEEGGGASDVPEDDLQTTCQCRRRDQNGYTSRRLCRKCVADRREALKSFQGKGDMDDLGFANCFRRDNGGAAGPSRRNDYPSDGRTTDRRSQHNGPRPNRGLGAQHDGPTTDSWRRQNGPSSDRWGRPDGPAGRSGQRNGPASDRWGHHDGPTRGRGGQHDESTRDRRGGQPNEPARNRRGQPDEPARDRWDQYDGPRPNRGRWDQCDGPRPNRGRWDHYDGPRPNRGRGGQNDGPIRGQGGQNAGHEEPPKMTVVQILSLTLIKLETELRTAEGGEPKGIAGQGLEVEEIVPSLKNVLPILQEAVRLLQPIKIEEIRWNIENERLVDKLKRLLMTGKPHFQHWSYFSPKTILDVEMIRRLNFLSSKLLSEMTVRVRSGLDSCNMLFYVVRNKTKSFPLTEIFGLPYTDMVKTATSNELNVDASITFYDNFPYEHYLSSLNDLLAKAKGDLSSASKIIVTTAPGDYVSFNEEITFLINDLSTLAIQFVRILNDPFYSSELFAVASKLTSLEDFAVGVAKVVPYTRVPNQARYWYDVVNSLYTAQSRNLNPTLIRIVGAMMGQENVPVLKLPSIFVGERLRSLISPTQIRPDVVCCNVFARGLEHLEELITEIQAQRSAPPGGNPALKQKKRLVRAFFTLCVSIYEHQPWWKFFHFVETSLSMAIRIISLTAVRTGDMLEDPLDPNWTISSKFSPKCLAYTAISLVIVATRSVSAYISKGNYDGEIVTPYLTYLPFVLTAFKKATGINLNVGGSKLVLKMMEIVTVVQNEFFELIPVVTRVRMISFVMQPVEETRLAGNGINAQIGRCLAYALGFNALANDQRFVMFSLSRIGPNIEHPIPTIRTPWTWAFAKWTDVMETFRHIPTLKDLRQLQIFVIQVIGMSKKLCSDVVNIRYNGYRAAANLLKWIPPSTMESPGVLHAIDELLQIISEQIGKGVDYKARWNAAHALGCAIENAQLQVAMPVVFQTFVLPPLHLWMIKSQHYKERIQCVAALSKINSRGLLGDDMFVSIVKKLIDIPGRVPKCNIDPDTLDILEEKLIDEVALCLAQFMSLLNPQDVSLLRLREDYLDVFSEIIKEAMYNMRNQRKEKFDKALARIRALNHAVNFEDNQVLKSLEEIFTPDYHESGESDYTSGPEPEEEEEG